jgi:hypothetical protein
VCLTAILRTSVLIRKKGLFPVADPIDGSDPTSDTDFPESSPSGITIPYIPSGFSTTQNLIEGVGTSHIGPYSTEIRKTPYPASPLSPMSTYHPYQPSMIDTWNTRSDLASALGVASRLTTEQRQTLIASLNDSSSDGEAGGREPSKSVEETLHMPSSSAAGETQEEAPDLAAILSVLSRARLSTRERDALVASLSSMTWRGQPTLARENSVSSPPPYAG